MRDAVFGLVLVLLAVVFFLVKILPDIQSQNPKDEEVIHTQEKDLRTGELFQIEIVRCRHCGQVISRVKFDAHGKAIAGQARVFHDCEREWGKKDARYRGLGTQGPDFNLWESLDKWQKRLRVKP